MRILGLEIGWAQKSSSGSMSIDQLIRRWEEAYAISSGIALNPDLAMQSPTVRAIVQAIAFRISTLPVQVLRKTVAANGRTTKTPLPDHPVAMLLAKPNDILNPSKYWVDATSWLVRYGNYYCWKGQGNTGPVRRLLPLHPSAVDVQQDQADPFRITYRVTFPGGRHDEFPPDKILHARGPARDGIKGDSPVMDVREAIGLEIAAEKFGAMFFGNGATPGLVLQTGAGSQGFKTDEERTKFRTSLEEVYGRRGRHRVFVLPKGIEVGQQIEINNDKAQFLATRQFQRTVISGAFGVPPHLVGDLSKGTFNNVEQQSLAFVSNVVQPYVTIFEQAMEQSLLTDEERAQGIIIRFNIDAALRADFKSRQEGLKIQREMGVINPNEWREHENMNPISDEDGGNTYWMKGPSGQGADPAAPEPTEPEPTEDDEGDEDAAS